MNSRLKKFFGALSGSYGQVFFSDNKLFAVFLAVASFADPSTGLCGLISAVFSILLARMFGLNPAYTNNGSYSFNSLLTGLALGAYFKLSGNFVFLLLTSSLLTLLMTSWLFSLASRHKLPFLSLPFILSTWIIFLNTRSFDPTLLQIRNSTADSMRLSTHAEVHGDCGEFWGESISLFDISLQNVFGSDLLQTYFKTMAAIFFQHNIIAGILIILGLVLYSRIAFLLSLVGFLSGFAYFKFVQGNVAGPGFDISASSYILSAIGLGGFFIVPSTRSFLHVVFSAPVIGLLAHSADKIIFPFGLPIYSLPFSLAVMIILSFINNFYGTGIFHLVQFQQFSPEKNLYAYHTYMERFKKETNTIIQLPFYGEWTVSQGHEGKITHKNDWRFAWDFVVKDEHKRTFKFPGKDVADFYSYGLPVLSPADGQVITIEDGIDDNEIGNVNLAQNWGNTIVIKHSEFLYSKLSHLKKGSFKMTEGGQVKKGEILALCGNSGRSPEPHIHFQLQGSEKIGAPTINYPISYYARKIHDNFQFHFFDVPGEDEVLMRPVATPVLKKAFNLVPGTKFKFEVTGQHNYNKENWEVFTDPFNNSYIRCNRTKATAYFKYDDTLFYFTGYKGNSDCLLYYFYLGAYKILLSQFKNLEITDRVSIEGTYKGPLKILQDFVAPFSIFLKTTYGSVVTDVGVLQQADRLRIVSRIRSNISGKNVDFEIEVCENKISEIKIIENTKCITAKNI